LFHSAVALLAVLFVAGGVIGQFSTRFGVVRAFLFTVLGTGLGVALSVEVLSALGVMSAIGFWLLLAAVGVVAWAKPRSTLAGLRRLWRSLRTWMWLLPDVNSRTGRRVLRVLLVAYFIIVGIVVFLSFWGPPNNADSMVYHLPRVMHWMQNDSVDFYPAATLRQLTTPWLGNYFVLVLMELGGSDLLANFAQLAAYFGAVGLTVIASRLITNSKVATSLTLIFAGTTPMALAQATTTQVDLISTLWVMSGVVIVLMTKGRAWKFWTGVFLLALTIGLAALTKPTGLLFLISVVVWLLMGHIYRNRSTLVAGIRQAAVASVVLFGAAVAGTAPVMLRTWGLLGQPFDTNISLWTERIGYDVTLGNIMRYLVQIVGIVPREIGDLLMPQIVNFASTLGVTWVDSTAVAYEHYAGLSFGRNEDYATQPVQLGLGLLATGIVVLLVRRHQVLRPLLPVAVVALSMLVTQATVWKWNHWSNRHIIPIALILSIPLSGLLAHFLIRQRGRFLKAGAVFVTASSIGFAAVFATGMQYRRLLPDPDIFQLSRNDRYFAVNAQSLTTPYQQISNSILSLPCGSRVDLYLGNDFPEYPLWALANRDLCYEFRIGQSINSLLLQAGEPDLVVCRDSCPTPINGARKVIWSSKSQTVTSFAP